VRAARSDLDRFGERLAEADPELWPGDPEVIRNRLGWVPVVGEMRPRAGELEAFADDVRRALPHTVLLGMGGSSLCPEVLRRAFHADALHVLDTTHPRAVVRAARDDCLYLVASKSGGTIETRSHEAYFFDQSGGDPARFAAVSDPGTELARSAVARGYRRVFENRPDIGGRYSALSYFGLVPAALAGIDVGRLLGGVETSGADGVELGRRLGELHAEGRDKVTIVAEGEYAGFGLWA
jgi:glucose-6-phosphate isomerase